MTPARTLGPAPKQSVDLLGQVDRIKPMLPEGMFTYEGEEYPMCTTVSIRPAALSSEQETEPEA